MKRIACQVGPNMEFISLPPDTRLPGETEEAWLRRLGPAEVPASAARWFIVDDADCPGGQGTTHPLRDAFCDVTPEEKVDFDPVKGREIMLRHIRGYRDAKLKELDGPWMRAFAQGNLTEAAAVEAERQKLRDLPATLRLTQTTASDMLAAWPAILPDPNL